MATVNPELESWALPQLATLLPSLDDESRKQIVQYTATLPDAQSVREHLTTLLGESDASSAFIGTFQEFQTAAPSGSQPNGHGNANGHSAEKEKMKLAEAHAAERRAPPPPFTAPAPAPVATSGEKAASRQQGQQPFVPPSGPPPSHGTSRAAVRHHSNQVTEAAKIRARDEVSSSSKAYPK